MAEITINEISSNYSYNVAASDYCTVALPMTACWGPAFEDPATLGVDLEAELEASAFIHFPSSQEGLESFISTYRGPAANYRSAQDYSYYVAMTLLASGYNIDVCRLSAGAHAEGKLNVTGGTQSLTFKAKYPGTFGNNLFVSFNKNATYNTWNMITYVVDPSGSRTAVENLSFVFNIENSTDTILHISEINSAFIDLVVDGITSDDVTFDGTSVTLAGGTDRAAATEADAMLEKAINYAKNRYDLEDGTSGEFYLTALRNIREVGTDATTASIILDREWVFLNTMHVLTILNDRLAYNSNRVILPGWDDQDITYLNGSKVATIDLSPLHIRLLKVAYSSRCATALLDIPRSLERSGVYNEDGSGYVQKLCRFTPQGQITTMFSSHSALFAPWGQYTYVGTSRLSVASPSFIALMIQRAEIRNQSNQYEWLMPSNKNHNLKLGKFDYTVPQSLLDKWQSIEGCSLNVLADIPELGVNIWGNSTLMEVPPATYNALQNLSTRYLMNAVKNVVYRVGLSITFQYNNQEAYSTFYAGCSPILDNMKALKAIEDYRIEMAADINGLDSVNANSVIGRIYLLVAGVINNITVDLIALPANAGIDLQAL